MAKRNPKTTYKPEIAELLSNYVDETLGRKRLPFIQEFCRKHQISRRTFYNWLGAKDENKNKLHPELNDAYDELMAMQEMMLTELGIAGKASAAMCIFLLKSKHGYIETEKVQHVGSGEEPLTLIFTDSATYKAHRENVVKREALNNKDNASNQVYHGEANLGGYDWSDPLTTPSQV